MSLRTQSTHDTNGVDTTVLSSNHKVIHYLQNSTRCSNNTNNNNQNSVIVLHKTPSHIHDLFNVKDTSMNKNNNNNNRHQSERRIRSSSENGSTSYVTDTL